MVATRNVEWPTSAGDVDLTAGCAWQVDRRGMKAAIVP